MAHATEKRNVTISLSRETIRKAKVLAAKRSTSISGLLAEHMEILVGTEGAYERPERAALVQRFDDLRDLWRAVLRRVEEVLDARLKHLEER